MQSTSKNSLPRLTSTALIGISIVMNTIDVHGSIAPLHSFHNLRLERILSNVGTFNNNISLVLVMTFERMILSSGKHYLIETIARDRLCLTF